MGRCICLCTYCEHHRPIEVQWAGGYHQLGHNEHRVPCIWSLTSLDRCGGQDNSGIVTYCVQYGVGPSVLYTGSRYNSHQTSIFLIYSMV